MFRQDPLLRQLMISAVQQSLEEEGNLLTPPPYRFSSSLLYLSIFLSLLFWLNQNNFLMTKTNNTKGRTRSYDNCVKEGRSQKVQLLDSTLQNTPRFLENIICLVCSLWNYVRLWDSTLQNTLKFSFLVFACFVCIFVLVFVFVA